MFHRIKKTRKYQAPFAKETQMALESNFCQTLRLNAQVDELKNINSVEDDGVGSSLYFEF